MDDPKKKIAFLILREQSPSKKTIKRSPRIYPEFRETLQKNDQSYLSSKCPFLHLK